jgi:hypothetical protein
VGTLLSGGSNHRLSLPANIPAANFWSVTLYEAENASGLTCTEIRHCGASSVQIMRRLHSMLENLMQTLPPHRHAELRQQLDLLDRVIERQYALPEDRAIARMPDPQDDSRRHELQA